MSTPKISITLLRKARASQRKLLNSKSNVVGTMLGVKLTDHAPTTSRSIIVAVQSKKPLAKLKTAERIPRSVTVDGVRIPIDVIAMGKFLPQNFNGPLACSDNKSIATVSALALSATGPVGVTCAHALKGLDDDIFTPEPVGMWSAQLESYIPVGRSGPVSKSPGLGVPGDYGFSDVGFFRLEEPIARNLHTGLKPLPIWNPGTADGKVQAMSVRGLLQGEIHALQVEMFGGYCDLIVRMDNDGTYMGDSGLLWKSTAGAAVGIHALGSEDSSGAGSRFSACMFAGRAAKMLRLQLLDTP